MWEKDKNGELQKTENTRILKKWSLLFVLMIFCIACNFVNDRRYLNITFNDSKLE